MRFSSVLLGALTLIAIGIIVSSSHAKVDENSIVGLWLLDEDKDIEAFDSSGNERTGTVLKANRWVPGKFGSALQNDGGTIIQVPHDDALSLQEFTLMCWVNLDDAGKGGWQATFGKQVDNPTRNFRIEINTADKARISFASNKQPGAGSVVGTSMIIDQEWHHIAATYDMEELKLYVDGILEGTQQKNLEPETNAEPLQMGMIHGIIDELAMFNVALEEEDIIRIKEEGLIEALLIAAVEPSNKLPGTWAEVKTQY